MAAMASWAAISPGSVSRQRHATKVAVGGQPLVAVRADSGGRQRPGRVVSNSGSATEAAASWYAQSDALMRPSQCL